MNTSYPANCISIRLAAAFLAVLISSTTLGAVALGLTGESLTAAVVTA